MKVLWTTVLALAIYQGVTLRNPADPDLDTTTPTVTISTPTSSATYDAGSDDTLTTLAGTSSDATGIAICTWSSDQGFSGTATTSANGNWTVSNITLEDGDNVITVTCLDPGRNGGADVLTVTTSLSDGGCPAWPTVPNEADWIDCTGPEDGVVLSSCSGNVTANNVTYENCNFLSGIDANNHTGITIRNSRIVGQIDGGGTSSSCQGWLLEHVEIDGNEANTSAFHNDCNGWTARNVECHEIAQCFYASGPWTVEDSYCHDIAGSPANGGSHNECILASGDGIVARHNYLAAEWNEDGPDGGGMSASAVLYTHGICGGFCWGDSDDVLFEQNTYVSSVSEYCVYGGYSTDNEPSNVRYLNNTHDIDCGNSGTILGWCRATTSGCEGNTWTNNRLSTGTVINEPTSSTYARWTPPTEDPSIRWAFRVLSGRLLGRIGFTVVRV